jgi:hypothetical protein
VAANSALIRMVPERGLEPPLPCENQVLNLARLPVPPFGHCFDSTLFALLSATNASQCSPASAEIRPIIVYLRVSTRNRVRRGQRQPARRQSHVALHLQPPHSARAF